MGYYYWICHNTIWTTLRYYVNEACVFVTNPNFPYPILHRWSSNFTKLWFIFHSSRTSQNDEHTTVKILTYVTFNYNLKPVIKTVSELLIKSISTHCMYLDRVRYQTVKCPFFQNDMILLYNKNVAMVSNTWTSMSDYFCSICLCSLKIIVKTKISVNLKTANVCHVCRVKEKNTISK